MLQNIQECTMPRFSSQIDATLLQLYELYAWNIDETVLRTRITTDTYAIMSHIGYNKLL